MAEKAKRIGFTSPAGTAIFPRIKTPDTKYDAGGVFVCKLAIERSEAVEDFIEFLETTRDEWLKNELKNSDAKKKAKLKKFAVADVYEDEIDDEDNETGRVIIKFKLNHTIEKKDGTTFTQRPSVFDAQGTQLKRIPNVGGGSQLVIGGTVIPYAMASTKSVGVSLRMEGVQVLELVEFGGKDASAFGFGSHDGGFAAPAASDDDYEEPDADDSDDEADEDDF